MYENNRKQRVVLNGQNSPWIDAEPGVPIDTILALLLFLIDINGLSDNLTSNPKLFADDTSLSCVVKVFSTSNLNSDLAKICSWRF